MKNIKYTLLSFAIVVGFYSCNDILDETPDNRGTIDSPDKISELLVGAYPLAGYTPFLEPMSDNAGDKGPSATDNRINEEMYFWRDLNDTDNDTPTNYWLEAYEAISQANQALASIDELLSVDSSLDLSEQKGEALLCRAYAHFMLATIFSKAYNPATAASDLGVPYVTTPENILIKEYSRGNVQEVYGNIRKDLEEGLPLIGDNYLVPKFHFNTKAANAFASRFYLTIGEWQKVIDHSTIALGGTGIGELRDWVNEYRPRTYSEQATRYSSANAEPANLLVVSAGSIYNRNHFLARYQLDGDTADILFNNLNETGKPWSYTVFGSGDLFNNIPKFREFFKVTNQAANTGFPFVGFVLLSTDEVILNRAEAYAMLGQYDNATDDINRSFEVKTASYTAADAFTISSIATAFAVTDATMFTPFYDIPSEALPFVNAVLRLKRTIFYNEGLRWFDIKRHDIAIVHTDVFGNTFELGKGDNRKAVQIPESAQSFGIEANPR